MRNNDNIWSLDVEADGPVPGIYSMLSFGLINIKDHSKNFYSQMRPMTENYIPEAMAVGVIGRRLTDEELHDNKTVKSIREQVMSYPEPNKVMKSFRQFLGDNGMITKRPILFSDNPGFDWAYLNYYMHYHNGENPLGWSCHRIGDLYCGLKRNMFTNNWKRMKKTKHTHNALDDAKGNAEALHAIISSFHS